MLKRGAKRLPWKRTKEERKQGTGERKPKEATPRKGRKKRAELPYSGKVR